MYCLFLISLSCQLFPHPNLIYLIVWSIYYHNALQALPTTETDNVVDDIAPLPQDNALLPVDNDDFQVEFDNDDAGGEEVVEEVAPIVRKHHHRSNACLHSDLGSYWSAPLHKRTGGKTRRRSNRVRRKPQRFEPWRLGWGTMQLYICCVYLLCILFYLVMMLYVFNWLHMDVYLSICS